VEGVRGLFVVVFVRRGDRGGGGEGIGKGERYLREEANGVQSDYRCDAGECAECEDSEEKSFFAARALDGEEEGDGEREDEYVN
jgi:hypothetical protein